ncbi:response regulator transcription factor [Faecalicatena contorta]|uniref:Stage 0 sporulation protein A homolog n=1 Tax=Faecalicatena fissicatena TaxID=290055 RepID=A0ABS2E4V0_9FIRM|nr:MULTISPECIES: response regulator transcription factor [Faecalicatena]MBM6684143.1 response regulator transcription factor [Faecalicatena contorta]MBM6709545.1 response regulator transcription factor [Faecalicatena contorta]MBM6736648.1 response regulator transcription factor [Faecalicatena fissicatena]
MAVRIGIIEDDQALREGLKLAFELDGWEVVCAATAKEGRRLTEGGGCDLVILDCNLPDGSGFDMLRGLREKEAPPVLMLTARSGEIDELQALELGVEDFMRKPFSLAVLKARARRILRRRETPSLLSSGDITVDMRSKEVRKGGELLSLSALETRLLILLMEHSGQILSREQILESVWDRQEKYVDENTLAVTVRRLRLKIEEHPSTPQRIRTIHGMGYIWKE